MEGTRRLNWKNEGPENFSFVFGTGSIELFRDLKEGIEVQRARVLALLSMCKWFPQIVKHYDELEKVAWNGGPRELHRVLGEMCRIVGPLIWGFQDEDHEELIVPGSRNSPNEKLAITT